VPSAGWRVFGRKRGGSQNEDQDQDSRGLWSLRRHQPLRRTLRRQLALRRQRLLSCGRAV